MVSIKENYDVFAINYDWPKRGDEWSDPWGGTFYLWAITIFPRIQSFLPSKHILEIAPGFGRCTQFLKNFCDNLTIVDLSEKCINACKERFQDCENIEYYTNDGQSLEMIPDQSIDFVFSWDSLVHADKSVMEAYISQLPRIMKPGGFGFLHHSNYSEYSNKLTRKFKYKNSHYRDETMDFSTFSKYSKKSGINCILQEKINWRCNFLNDCFSVITFRNDKLQLQNLVIENYSFMEEAKFAKYLSDNYMFR
jgi:ubiquinone/menaquinone biosynthesis C-methylase UbiE